MLNQIIKKSITIVLLLLVGLSTFAQTVVFKGKATDTLQNPLANTNILFFPSNQNEDKVRFSITDQDGFYQATLKKDISYIMEISYLGFTTYKDTIKLSQDTTRNITLIPSTQSLEEIILTDRTPVKVREDTITYRPEKFLTGEERKLRDVLKKLPGLDVDRAGNVTVNGKEVTKLLVDGKEFFTGDEKLGVNNIPADVIDEIEALDNYNDVSFLKGLSDSEQLALNIKLKEGKKKFAFGELEAGGGIEDRYLLHPTLFYYSPKTSINAIGDFNNIGKKSFTTQDYIDFEGGFSRLIEDPSAYFKLYNDDFARFLSQRDFTFNRNNFGALSINQTLTPQIDLSAYSILSGGTIQTRQENNITYFSNQNLDEQRLTAQNNKLFFSLTKASLRYIGEENLDMSYELFLKTNSGKARSTLQSFTGSEDTFLNQTNTPSSSDITQKVSINKQFTSKHTTSIHLSHKYVDTHTRGDWDFNRPVFMGIIPIENTGNAILLNQSRKNKGHDLNFNTKHYWVLHRFHHIYPEAGIRYIDQQYDTYDAQALENNTNDFTAAGFNNDLDYRLSDTYAGLQYKAKAGKFIFKPGIFYHYYDWKIKQLDSELRQTGKTVVLPELSIDWELNSSHKVKLRYNLNSRFGEASQFANRLRLSTFNQVFAGNERLENELYHSARIIYSKFSLFKGTFLNAGFNYTNRLQSIRNSTVLEGIDQINTLVYTSLPENSYSGNFQYTKLLGDYKVKIGSNASLSDYSRIINSELQDFESQNYSYSLGFETRFKNAPNIEFNWTHRFNIFESATTRTNFTQINPSVHLEYRFFKDFVIDADYNYTYYQNKSLNQINRFSLGNTSLLYAKEDSPWTFTVDVDNIFDTRFKNENSFNQFLVNDTRTFIQERTVLFKIGYKF